VTSNIGAVQTTNEWGEIVKGFPVDGKWQQAFVDATIKTMEMDDKEREEKQAQAACRFDWDVICDEWERVITQ